MSTLSLDTEIRPLRIGLCVEGSDIKGLVKASKIAVLLWGGHMNPIIPISDKKLSEGLIDVFDVELLYNVTGSVVVSKFIDAHEELRHGTPHSRDVMFMTTLDGSKQRLIPLDIKKAIDWDVTRLSTSEELNTSWIRLDWDDKDEFNALFHLEFGKLQNKFNLNIDYDSYFKRKHNPANIKVKPTESIKAEFVEFSTPYLAGHYRVMHYSEGGGRWASPGIYIGSPKNFNDLVNFWNVRASGENIKFCPIEPGRLQEFIQAHITRVIATNRQKEVNFWHSRETKDETVNSVIKKFNAGEAAKVVHGVDHHNWNGLNITPWWMVIKRDSVLADFDEKYGRPAVTFQIPKFLPDERDHVIEAQAMVLKVNPLTEFEYAGSTLKLPRLSDLNEWYSRRIYFTPDLIRAQGDGFKFITETSDSDTSFTPIKSEDLIIKLFERAGLDAKQSQAGLIAERMIEHMGGLESQRVFKIKGVRKLISNLNKDDLTQRSDAKIVILDKDESTEVPSFKKHEDLRIQFRTSGSKTTTDEVFDFLLEHQLFKAGLEFTCPNCNIKSWLPIDGLSEETKCEYCGYIYRSINQLKSGNDWKFRKSGLLSRDNHQEGSIPVIITILQLQRRVDKSNPLFSTSLKLKSNKLGIDCEIDFALLGDRYRFSRRGRLQIAIGEAKNLGKITDNDVKNLVKVRDALNKSGLEAYMVLSKFEQFTEGEIATIKKHIKKPEEAILFSDVELEPYDPYDDLRGASGKSKLKIPYAHGFDEMAINSHGLYLEDKKKTKKTSGTAKK